MKRRLVIVTEIIAPYRIPVFNALTKQDDVELHVIFLSETDSSLRQWLVYRDEIKFSYEVLKSFRRRLGKFNFLMSRGLETALASSKPDAILCGGYSYLAAWQALRWARIRGVRFLLWSESNSADARNNFSLVEAVKRKFIHSCDGYVVPGTSAARYLQSFGVAEEEIFVAPNAVDVERFARAAEGAKSNPGRREQLGLPTRYLLYVGRFVAAKGIFDLLAAYAKLPKEMRGEVGLVLAGDGEERAELIRRSRQIAPGRVLYPGFVQRDELGELYGLAEGLILPTHSDSWGLVVNEALACGLPVIASDVAGCTADLVQDGVNGFVVGAGQVDALGYAMERLLREPEARKRMGASSAQMSELFTPNRWAAGVADAVADHSGARVG